MLGGITGKGFMPGQSGNPGGRPKKQYISEIYDDILSDPLNRKEIMDIVWKMLRSGKMSAQLQLKEMAERTEGKVTQPVQADVSVNLTLSERMNKAEERLKSSE